MRPARRSPGGGGGAATGTAAAGPRRAGVRQEEAPPSRRRRPWAGNRGAAAARARAGLRSADKAAVVGLLPVTGPHLGPQPAPSAAARPGEGIGSGLAVMAPERAKRAVAAASHLGGGRGLRCPTPGGGRGISALLARSRPRAGVWPLPLFLLPRPVQVTPGEAISGWLSGLGGLCLWVWSWSGEGDNLQAEESSSPSEAPPA